MVDAEHLKCSVRKGVRVRIPLPVPDAIKSLNTQYGIEAFCFIQPLQLTVSVNVLVT